MLSNVEVVLDIAEWFISCGITPHKFLSIVDADDNDDDDDVDVDDVDDDDVVATFLLLPPGDHVGDADADHDGQCDVIYLVMI